MTQDRSQLFPVPSFWCVSRSVRHLRGMPMLALMKVRRCSRHLVQSANDV